MKLLAPRFVAPYRKSGKNDGNDAEAICEAVSSAEHALRADQGSRRSSSKRSCAYTGCARGSSRNARRQSIGCAGCWRSLVL